MAKIQNKNIGLVKDIQKVLLDNSDFLRTLVQENMKNVLIAEFDEFLQAAPYENNQERTGYRNG